MAVNNVSNLTLGNFLKIVSRDSVYNNLSEDSPLWDFIKKFKAGPEAGRESRFLLRSAYGSAAGGFVGVDGGAFPSAHRQTITEGTAQYKDYAVTIETELTLIEKAISDFDSYGKPLAEETESKTIGMARILSSSAYRDGTGVIGTNSSTAIVDNGDTATFTLDTADTARGFVGWFEFGDKVTIHATDGTARAPTISAGTFSHFIVIAKDRAADTVELRPVNTLDAEVSYTGAGDIVAGDVIYRDQLPTKPDLTTLTTSIDLGTFTEEWPGLAAFAKNDGQTVNGIPLSGALGATIKDLGGAPIDSQAFQQLMSQVMVSVGSRYSYSSSMMAMETLDALVESRETDRRFIDAKDEKRGVKGIGYIAGKNELVFEADEFCPKNRIYCLPEGKKGVIQFFGSDFDFVRPQGGQQFFLRPNSSGHDQTLRAYMRGSGLLLCVHAAGIGQLKNFTV